MKIFHYTKSHLRIYLKQIMGLFLSVAVVPLLLTLVNGYTMQFQNSADVEYIKNAVYFDIKDQGTLANRLQEVMGEPEIEKFVQQTELLDEADYILRFPENYSEAALKGEPYEIQLIHHSTGASTQTGLALKQVVMSISKELSRMDIIRGEVERVDKPEQVFAQIDALYQKAAPSYHRQALGDTRTLDSYDQAGVNSVVILLFTIMLAAIHTYENPVLLGYKKRVVSSPLTNTQITVSEYLSDLLIFWLLYTIFVLILKITGISFKGDLMTHLLLGFLQCSFVILFSKFIMMFVPKMLATTVMTSLLVIAILTSSFSGEIQEDPNSFIAILSKFSIAGLVTDPHFRLMEGMDLSSISENLIALVIGSVILMGLLLFISKKVKDVRL